MSADSEQNKNIQELRAKYDDADVAHNDEETANNSRGCGWQ